MLITYKILSYILSTELAAISSDLLVTLYPHILLSLGSCTLCVCCYPCIFLSSYPQVHVLQDWYPRVLRSSYPQVYVFLFVTLYPHILLSLGSYTLCACCYISILMASYPQVYVLQEFVGILAYSPRLPLKPKKALSRQIMTLL